MMLLGLCSQAGAESAAENAMYQDASSNVQEQLQPTMSGYGKNGELNLIGTGNFSLYMFIIFFFQGSLASHIF